MPRRVGERHSNPAVTSASRHGSPTRGSTVELPTHADHSLTRVVTMKNRNKQTKFPVVSRDESVRRQAAPVPAHPWWRRRESSESCRRTKKSGRSRMQRRWSSVSDCSSLLAVVFISHPQRKHWRCSWSVSCKRHTT